MSSIKLTADSNGGTFEVKAPSSSSNTRVLTLPDTANGTMLTTTNPASGNVVQTAQTLVSSTSSLVINAANTNFPITVLDTTITSKYANSKFIFSGQIFAESNNEDHDLAFNLGRVIGGTETYFARGDADGQRARITRNMAVGFRDSDNSSTPSQTIFGSIIDSPAQAAGTAITYRLNVFATGGTPSWNFYINRALDDTNDLHIERGVSYILIQEVAP